MHAQAVLRAGDILSDNLLCLMVGSSFYTLMRVSSAFCKRRRAYVICRVCGRDGVMIARSYLYTVLKVLSY